MSWRATRQALCFIAVGSVAALMHWLIVVLLVSLCHWRPLHANVWGWLFAFVVSFSGHYGLTFRHLGGALGPSAARFFVVSALGFALNQLVYAALLHWTDGRAYALVLGAVLLLVAGATYVLSLRWAFAGKPKS